MTATVLVIVHGLVAVVLLGAITHQALATWASAAAKPGSFFGRFRAVTPESFANAIVVLYLTAAALARSSIYISASTSGRNLSATLTSRRWGYSTSRSISSQSA